MENSFPPLLVIFWWSNRPDIYQALFHPWILQFSPRLFWTLMLIGKCCFRIDVKETKIRQFGVILPIFSLKYFQGPSANKKICEVFNARAPS